MKIATWNVNGIRARAAQLRAWLDEERPDVLCLQELKAEANQIPEENKLPDYHVYWHTRKGYSGVSLHIRKDLVSGEPAYSHPSFDMESRVVQLEHEDLTIASVYVPNGGKDYLAKVAFFKSLIDWTRQVHSTGRRLVICGDLNIARADIDVHPKERKSTVVGQLAEERQLFQNLLDTPLVDVARARDPENEGLFTWWAPWRNLRARNIGWRIDYILASPAVADQASSCVVRTTVGTSDHAPVVMTLS